MNTTSWNFFTLVLTGHTHDRRIKPPQSRWEGVVGIAVLQRATRFPSQMSCHVQLGRAVTWWYGNGQHTYGHVMWPRGTFSKVPVTCNWATLPHDGMAKSVMQIGATTSPIAPWRGKSVIVVKPLSYIVRHHIVVTDVVMLHSCWHKTLCTTMRGCIKGADKCVNSRTIPRVVRSCHLKATSGS